MMTRETVTHHVWWTDRAKPRHAARAICGVEILRRESVPDPTCPVCRSILAEFDREVSPDDPGSVVPR